MGFGKRLLEAYKETIKEPPRKDLRRKFALSPLKSDKELFHEYPLADDQWFDADLPESFWYLAGSKSLVIPDSWNDVISDFKKHLQKACVPQLNFNARLKNQLYSFFWRCSTYVYS